MSPQRLLLPALQAVCGPGWTFRECASPKDIASECQRWTPAVVVVDLSVDAVRLSPADLPQLADRPVAVVGLMSPGRGLGAALQLPPAIHCAVAADDPLEEWPLAMRAALRGATHFSPKLTARLAEMAPLPPPTGGKPLSQREQEVLMLVRTGSTARTIAAHLQVGIKTVESHLQRIKWKLGAASVTTLRGR